MEVFFNKRSIRILSLREHIGAEVIYLNSYKYVAHETEHVAGIYTRGSKSHQPLQRDHIPASQQHLVPQRRQPE